MTQINRTAFFPEMLDPANLLGPAIMPKLIGRVTNEHPASSYGQPVFVSADGSVYGPGDGAVIGRRLYVDHVVDEPETESGMQEYDSIVGACEAAGWRVSE